MIIGMACLVLCGMGIWILISGFNRSRKDKNELPEVIVELGKMGIMILAAKEVHDIFTGNSNHHDYGKTQSCEQKFGSDAFTQRI